LSVERELKFASVDLSGLRDRLEELEAEKTSPASFEDNWIFDRKGELESEKSLLRLRLDGQGARVTFKGPPIFEEGVKIRKEIETTVGDGGVARELLESLGYGVVSRYQKYREEWHLGGVVIALDHTPIGDFAEFEGDGAATVARRSGFEVATAVEDSYLGLYRAHLREHPDAPPEMTFREP
jgi:adenylate cyclase class 2